VEPEILTQEEVREMLVAVGAARSLTPDDHARSFDELDLDSLARTELAARIRDRYGIDVEDELTEEASPAVMRELVNSRLETA
jgi:acyl carrier protein